MVKIGKKIKNFTRPATGDKTVSLSDLTGKKIVLYFYPKDDTPGCTTEGQDFRDAKEKFTQQNAIIFGVSRDSIKKHESFKTKFDFNFDLLSDTDESLCKQFDVLKLKKLYGLKKLCGKEYMGIERSTFLIDEDGVLQKEWRGVKVKDHVDAVLTACKKI
jgi:peroxiredoxin Q/BCP